MGAYFSDTLQELSLQILKKEKVLREYKVLEECCNALKAQISELAASRTKEEEEAVKARENFFLSHFAKGKVSKEELEAYVAQEKYEMACKELELLEMQLKDSQRRLQAFGDCETKYQHLYEEVRQEILKKADEKAQRILETEAAIVALEGRMVEVNEALDLAKKADVLAGDISKEINNLKECGFWSIPIVKKLCDMAAGLNALLTGLKGEMKDISLRGEFSQFYVDGALEFTDFFLDDAISHYSLRQRMCEMSPRLTNVRSDIYKAQDEIEKVQKEYKNKLEEKRGELKRLIVEGE